MIKCPNPKCGTFIDVKYDKCPYCHTIIEKKSEERSNPKRTVVLKSINKEKSKETPPPPPKSSKPKPQNSRGVVMEAVVAWLVIIDGLGMGKSFEIHSGINDIGKGSQNSISIDFNDNKIEDIRHFVIIYDYKKQAFLIQKGSNNAQLFLNNKEILFFENLEDGDIIKVGDTTMKFVAFCKNEFQWNFKE